LVKITPEPSATRYTAFKVIRSDIEIAITLPGGLLDYIQFVQSFITTQATANVQGQRRWIGSATSNLAWRHGGKDWRGSGGATENAGVENAIRAKL